MLNNTGPAGERMPYGQLVQNVNLHRMWEEVSGIAEFSSRRLRVDEYNAASRYRKRGLAMLPVCYGINFGQPLLNQAGALVMIYTGMLLFCANGVFACLFMWPSLLQMEVCL